jgi:hypothetical protein
MSNYINVLRRLERERRGPEPVPVAAPVPAADIAAPAGAPLAPPIIATPEPHPAPAARTVIPLPSVAPAAAPSVVTPPTVAPPPSPAPLAPPPIAAPAVPAARIEQPVPPSVPYAPAPPLDTRRARAFAPDPHPGIATLLDNIRMLSGQRAGRIVVLCGASTMEPVAPLAAQLAEHAVARGMRAMVGTLLRTPAGSVVTPAAGAADDAASIRVDLDAGPSSDDLHAWAQRVAPANDLVVLTGPPLASSIDAALLACACDGLVIVAESEVTDRVALQTAAERARIAGCRTLGVVMHGTKDRMPGWIRRIVGDHPETAARKD